jgi:hypothetical protein
MSHCREASKVMEYASNAFEDFVLDYYFLESTAYYANGGTRGLE